jgi:5'-deoxynucleotidase YfbR-like HD superfamily hydrolase
MNWMVVATGGRFMFGMGGQRQYVGIDDIAYSLSRIPRYNGQFAPDVPHYSVAQHSVLVSRMVPPEMRLAALLHDGHEAYTGDIIVPMQREFEHRLPGFQKMLHELQDEIQAEIHRAYDIIHPLSADWVATIHEADVAVMRMEREQILTPTRWTKNWSCDTQPVRIQFPVEASFQPLIASEAHAAFMTRFHDLMRPTSLEPPACTNDPQWTTMVTS